MGTQLFTGWQDVGGRDGRGHRVLARERDTFELLGTFDVPTMRNAVVLNANVLIVVHPGCSGVAASCFCGRDSKASRLGGVTGFSFSAWLGLGNPRATIWRIRRLATTSQSTRLGRVKMVPTVVPRGANYGAVQLASICIDLLSNGEESVGNRASGTGV